MCYRDGSVHVPLGSCPMEVIIIIITSLSAAGVFNAARAPSADFAVLMFFFMLLA